MQQNTLRFLGFNMLAQALSPQENAIAAPGMEAPRYLRPYEIDHFFGQAARDSDRVCAALLVCELLTGLPVDVLMDGRWEVADGDESLSACFFNTDYDPRIIRSGLPMTPLADYLFHNSLGGRRVFRKHGDERLDYADINAALVRIGDRACIPDLTHEDLLNTYEYVALFDQMANCL